ncbi:ABC transporter permease [Fulvivirgaceae bacterium BMA12]|uniref:ABC transporter permease n=1 Tax=Agaribacillus aureus TaxID=3051825 RepID=A0ABT8LDP9_9BACT|nr:ABC transporter permease [Fulvivirgaceae bacterium BMA12]
MLNQYAKTLLRILWKDKIRNAVNIFGLFLGMASAVIIAKYIGYSLTFDNFHSNQNNIFKLSQVERKNGNITYEGQLTYPGITIASRDAIPEIVNHTKFSQRVETLVMVYDKQGDVMSSNERRIFSVDSSFLQMFTFKTLLGMQKNALTDPNAVVITQSTAKKYFGHDNPIGRSIVTRVPWGREESRTITCVLEDPPRNSKVKFDMLFASLEDETLWDKPTSYQYIQTNSGVDANDLSGKISSFISSQTVFKDKGSKIAVKLIPLAPALSPFELMLAYVGLLILLLSWINFINLSIAQSLSRTGEVFIKKALGSTNLQLALQFIFETLFINCLAFFLTVFFLFVTYDHFMGFAGNHLLPLFSDVLHINSFFFLLFIFGFILTAAYPALFLITRKNSGIARVGEVKTTKGQRIRRGLVVTQFAISSVLMIGLFVMSSQLNYMKTKALGFRSQNQLIIKPPKDNWRGRMVKMKYLKNEIAKLPLINSLTSSTTIPGQSYRQEVNFSKIGSGDSVMLYVNGVDENYLDTYGIRLLTGTNFSRRSSTSSNQTKVIINEVSARALGLSPDQAIGERLFDYETKETYTIIGVIDNYHKTSLRYKIEPMILKFNPRSGYITMNVTPNATYALRDITKKLSHIWENAYSDQPFEYFLLEDKYHEQYQAEDTFFKIFSVFTFISVVLASIGLIGLALFEVANSKLEVGIRKTFGASARAILFLFFKKYFLLLLVATVIGIPVSFRVMDLWLTNYSYRISIGMEHVLLPSIVLLMVALSTILLQIVRLSQLNPIKVLREE